MIVWLTYASRILNTYPRITSLPIYVTPNLHPFLSNLESNQFVCYTATCIDNSVTNLCCQVASLQHDELVSVNFQHDALVLSVVLKPSVLWAVDSIYTTAQAYRRHD